MNLTYRKCTIDDLEILRELSCQTFRDTYGHLNSEANMKAYLEFAYDTSKLLKELSNSSTCFYFVYDSNKLAGFLKLNEHDAQTDIHDPLSLEIERIYLAREFQGKGLGKALINKVVELATSSGKTYLWLGVWEKNDKAISFYKKNGFYKFGKHSFIIGDDEQADIIMRKDLVF